MSSSPSPLSSSQTADESSGGPCSARPTSAVVPLQLGDALGSGGRRAGVVVGAAFDAVVVDASTLCRSGSGQVVELVDIDGLTYAEAAEVIGVPVGTMMSRLHRSRTRIKKRLAAAGMAPRRNE